MRSRYGSKNERRAAEELIEVLDSLPEIVATFDGDGQLLYLNATGRRLLDRRESGTEPLIMSDLMPEAAAESLLRDALPEAVRSGMWKGRGQLLTGGGGRIPVMQYLMSHPPEEGKLRAFTLYARPAEETVEEQETLVASSLGFLHDLNNLLSPIIAYATLAGDRIEDEDPAKRYLGHILTAAERARELSARLLQKLRPQAGASRTVELSQLVQEVVAWLRGDYPQHRFEVEPLPSGAGVLGDPVGLEQMVLNLCKNAVESLPPEGGRW